MQDKINDMINNIKIFKSNTYYRLGDAILQHKNTKYIYDKIKDNRDYDNTILKYYLENNKTMNLKHLKINLINAINKKINTLNNFIFPKNDELVIHLRLGDVIFHPKRYMKKNYESIIDDHITKYNINSIATAKLGTVVVGALGGKKARVSADDFLPFDTRKLKKQAGISDESLVILQRLMKTRRLDGRVISLLANELKTASSREQGSD